jgi:hypothetical protein
LYQNYALDILSLRRGSLQDEAMRFSRRVSEPRAPAPEREPAAA